MLSLFYLLQDPAVTCIDYPRTAQDHQIRGPKDNLAGLLINAQHANRVHFPSAIINIPIVQNGLNSFK